MNLSTDRRMQSRKRPVSLVYVELPPSNGGMLRDLSEHGFSLRAMMPLHLSEKLPFSISLNNGVRLDGDAIVVRLEDNGHVAALEFAGLAAHSRDQIRRWLEKFEEPLSREAKAPKPPTVPVSTLEELRQEARTVIAGPPPHAEPLAPPSSLSAPPLIPPQLQQPLPPEPPLPPAPSITAPVQLIEPAPPTPPSVSHQPEVAAALPLLQIKIPLQPTPEPPAPTPEPAPRQSSEAKELPLPHYLRLPENAPPPPPAPKLPPLLKLSSVQPSAHSEPSTETISPAAHSPAVEARPTPNPVPLSEVLIQPPSVAAMHTSPPAKTSASSRVPPPLEPLSLWEAEIDAASPGWMESFTLGRAISIMIFLTLLVGSLVFHREVGQALIWLGQQIAGGKPQETSQATQPMLSTSIVTAQSPAATASSPPAPASAPQEATSSENKKVALPPSETSAAPQTEANRGPDAVPADSSFGNGQNEYQRAMQILKTPSRKAELSEAIRLLWLAVRKNHVGAEITLAELYHQGRGVPKSCDQTRILLSAAARRGSPDANKRLQEFQREGCQD